MKFQNKFHISIPRSSVVTSSTRFVFMCLCLILCVSQIFHVSAFSPIGTSISLRQTNQKASYSILQMTDEPPLTAFLDKMSKTGMDNTKIPKGGLVVAKYDLPQLGIFADQTYELQSIYMQGMKQGNGIATDGKDDGERQGCGIIDKIDLPELDLSHPNGFSNIPPGYNLYIKLYSEMYHGNDAFRKQAVVTTPQEVGLVSMKDEVFDSVLVALPILSFWLGTCFTFSNWYTAKYGGSFLDAFFRT